MIVINKLKFPLYGIIIIVSILVGYIYVYRSLKRDNFNDKNIKLLWLLYFTFPIVFGLLYTMCTNSSVHSILESGLSSYGGLIGIILSSIIFEFIVPSDKKIIKYSILSLPLIYGISKIACFVSGCCYGIPYDGIFSVRYPQGLNINLFPVQFVETITFIILFIILNKFKNNKYIIYITIIMCALAKGLLDFLRYEHVNKVITNNQIFSIILVIVTIIVFIVNKIINRKKC